MRSIFAIMAAIGVAGWSFAATAQSAPPNYYVRLDTGGSFSRNAGKNLQADVGSSPIVGLGIGARLLPSLRTDLTVSYRPGYSFSATDTTFSPGTTLIAKGDVKTLAVLINAYYDFPAIAGFTPYVGGGVGLARNDIGKSTITTTTGLPVATIDGDTSTHFAWQVGAGVSYAISTAVTLDIGYRYFDAGEGKSADTGTVLGVPATGLTNRGDVRAHEVQVGLRIGF